MERKINHLVSLQADIAKASKVKNRSRMDPKTSPTCSMSKATWYVFTSRSITHKRLLKKFRREDHGLYHWKLVFYYL